MSISISIESVNDNSKRPRDNEKDSDSLDSEDKIPKPARKVKKLLGGAVSLELKMARKKSSGDRAKRIVSKVHPVAMKARVGNALMVNFSRLPDPASYAEAMRAPDVSKFVEA